MNKSIPVLVGIASLVVGIVLTRAMLQNPSLSKVGGVAIAGAAVCALIAPKK